MHNKIKNKYLTPLRRTAVRIQVRRIFPAVSSTGFRVTEAKRALGEKLLIKLTPNTAEY